ncbi:hypothetical protein BSL78_10962 [Apostichopus japonicus]|uniref:Uncharacterized protein n=1 Tax=Stichopus japonicus TaxID=307972 RepID=A0A2G8KVX6_STIJA|nr:hypothetical protein BSL78_10962 [Apostichopus japonicus]
MVLKAVLGVAMIAITIVAVATPEVSFMMLVTIASIVVVAMMVVIAFDRAILHHLALKPIDQPQANEDISKVK